MIHICPDELRVIQMIVMTGMQAISFYGWVVLDLFRSHK